MSHEFKNADIDVARLRDLLDYDPLTGVFRWKANKGRARAGSVAGTLSRGYLYIKLDQQHYLAHRLAWLHVRGQWPSKQIDHINRDKSDNRLENLREVSMSENQQNMGLHTNNTSGIRGVYWSKEKSRWVSSVVLNGKKVYRGYFKDIEEAAQAYAIAAAKFHSINPFASVQDRP